MQLNFHPLLTPSNRISIGLGDRFQNNPNRISHALDKVLEDGVTGKHLGLELEDEGATPSSAANFFQTQEGASIHLGVPRDLTRFRKRLQTCFHWIEEL